MNRSCRACAAAWILALCVSAVWGQGAAAQFSQGPVELSGAVALDEADSAVQTSLERVRAYVADQQWDEAVESLRRLMESDGAKMVSVTPTRFVNLADYCHLQIASLPDEALALYRQRVDPLAQNWYDEAVAARDPGRLAEIVDTMYCSSVGDDALWVLGEIELERAHYSAARKCWEQLIEVPPGRVPKAFYEAARGQAELPENVARLLDAWYELDEAAAEPHYAMRGAGLLVDDDRRALVEFWKSRGLPFARLMYPSSDLELADIRARLILVSIMEGSLARARQELASFAELHPGASGRLAGQTVDYAKTLAAMADAAEAWPDIERSTDWPTFAGSFTRDRSAPENLDLGPQAWPPIALGEPHTANSANSRAFSLRRIGEDAQRLMSYHPLVAGNLLLVNNQHQIFAFHLDTGTPAWRGDAERPPGEIYVDDAKAIGLGRSSRGLGVPRFTMTVHDGKLYARMGSQITSHPLESYETRSGGYLVCLDLAAQGRLVWKPDGRLLPDDENWSFEGPPVVDGSDLYVAMRKSDVRPQAYVACFDIESGRRRWRTLVCSAETPGGGQLPEITHNLLTFNEGTLYYNTNLGAVAAMAARDGRLLWASLYERAKKATPDGQDKRTAHFYRDLNPCIYDRGRLLVAPADCESIFALDAGTGERLWETLLPEDVVHLLGVGEGHLLASGDALWWIDVAGGKVLKRWPASSPLGHGRGILTGEQVVWPTEEALYVFPQNPARLGAEARSPILLTERAAAGGNLVAARGMLIIAAPDKLYAFRQQGPRPANEISKVARRTRPAADGNPPAKAAK